MYAKYTWLSTATEAQVRADLVALATGTTDINSLSASCDKAFTSIVANTTATNWTVHDADASATSQVLRSLNADGTTYKYAQFTINNGTFNMTGWEAWDSVTHVGTNRTTTNGLAMSSSFMATFSYTNTGSIYIFSTPRYLTLSVPKSMSTAGQMSVVEFSRDSPSLNISYPCHALFGSNLAFISSATQNDVGICRIKSNSSVGDLTGTDLNGTINTLVNFPTYGGGNQVYQRAPGRGVGEVPYYTVLPIILGFIQGPWNGGVLGKVQGGLLYMPSYNPSFNRFDEMVIGSSTYVMIDLMSESSGALLIPKA